MASHGFRCPLCCRGIRGRHGVLGAVGLELVQLRHQLGRGIGDWCYKGSWLGCSLGTGEAMS